MDNEKDVLGDGGPRCWGHRKRERGQITEGLRVKGDRGKCSLSWVTRCLSEKKGNGRDKALDEGMGMRPLEDRPDDVP